jgi:hypothetical protein
VGKPHRGATPAGLPQGRSPRGTRAVAASVSNEFFDAAKRPLPVPNEGTPIAELV